MKLRHKKILLYLAAVMLGIGSAAAVRWGAFAPYQQFEAEAPLNVLVSQPESNASALPPREQMQALAALELGRPLFDPEAAPPPPKAPLQLELTGTVVEPGHSLAMLRLPDGRLELKGVGEESGGAKILSIDQTSVTVLHEGEQVTLTVKGQQEEGS